MERQEQALQRWLLDHPEYQLAEELIDAGVSAGRGKHRTKGALAAFIAGARSGVIPQGSCLVIESVSRFTREASTDALMALLGDVLQPGLAIAFTGFDSGRVITAERWNREPGLKYGLIAALDSARTEWEERSARSRGGARKRERLQEAGEKAAAATPWWIQRDPETRRLVRDRDGGMVLNPVAAATIRRAVELACSGLGTTLIATTLNAEGRPLPPTSGRRNQYSEQASDQWSHGRVSYLLRHLALLGDLQRRDGRIIRGFYPPVLSIEQWQLLRASVEIRDKLRGSLRGGGQRVNNLFMGLVRCADCGGPMSFHATSERARIGHAGYIACREANRRTGAACSNKGYLNYAEVEAHLLTRLASPIWEELLGRPGQEKEVEQLQREVDRLALERRTLEARLADAEERLQDLWLGGASEIKQELAEKAVAKLRQQMAAAKATHDQQAAELQLLRAKPSGSEAAAEMRRQVLDFWERITTASPAERRSFNRWLRTRKPAIEFIVHPLPAHENDRSERPIELRVDGRCAGIEPLAGAARQTARDHGMVAPTVAVQVPLGSDGDALIRLEGDGIRQTLARLQDGGFEDHTKTFAVWHANKPLQPAISHLLKLLPAKLQEMGITNLDAQQQMRLAILLAEDALREPAPGG